MSKIGFFGGCFNPPNNLHINIANNLINSKKLDKVIFVPVNDFYKKDSLIDAKYRYEMLKLAVKDYSNLDVDDIEKLSGELGVGESANIEIIFVATTAGEKVNTAFVGNNLTNQTENSTNTTNVTEIPKDNDTNETQEDVPKDNQTTVDVPKDNQTTVDVPKETQTKSLKVTNATGNPLFALAIVLSILGIIPLRRKK